MVPGIRCRCIAASRNSAVARDPPGRPVRLGSAGVLDRGGHLSRGCSFVMSTACDATKSAARPVERSAISCRRSSPSLSTQRIDSARITGAVRRGDARGSPPFCCRVRAIAEAPTGALHRSAGPESRSGCRPGPRMIHSDAAPPVLGSSVRHSTASTPCAGAGISSVGSKGVAGPSRRPSLDSPAIASTRASTSPSASLRSRVSTFPRIGTICSWRPVARSRAARRGDPVPIRAPDGRASRLVPPGQTSASRGSSRAGNAATCSPGTGAVGRSLQEYTTKSTAPSQQRLAQGGGEHPGCAEPFDRRGRPIPRRGHRDHNGRPGRTARTTAGRSGRPGPARADCRGCPAAVAVGRGAHVPASPVRRSKSWRSASR